MSTWTLDSLAPPDPEDHIGYSTGHNFLAAADACTLPLPVRTGHFTNQSAKTPTLDDELVRLCRSHQDEWLAVLADALRATVKGRVGRGRPKGSETVRSGIRFDPVTTKSFESAVRKHPVLREELKHLCEALPGEALAALAGALRASVKGRVRRGRHRLDGIGGLIPAPIRLAVQIRKRHGVPDHWIARAIEHMLPRGQAANAPGADSSLRKRAQRIVAAVPLSARGGVRLSFGLALELWALTRARRQLEAAMRRDVLTPEEAEHRYEERKARFMSRALGRARA